MLDQNANNFLASQMVGEIRRAVPGSQMPIDHHHPVLELNLVLRGTGRYELQDATLPLRAGALVWIAAGLRHRLVRTAHLDMWVMVVRPELVEPSWHAWVQAHPLHRLEPRELVELDRLFCEVAGDSDDVATYNAGIAYAMRRAQRAARGKPGVAHEVHPAVARALLLMRDTDGRLTLPEVAEHTGVVASYLSRLFVQHTHRSFVAWRNRIRLMRFIKQFRQGDTLLGAAEDAGFGSYAQFHRVFVDLVGCSPRHWLRERTRMWDPDPAGLAASLESYLPTHPALPQRQRWSALLPENAPLIAHCCGEDFIARLCQPPRDAPAEQEPEMQLTAEAIVQAVRAHHAADAEALVEQVLAQDLATQYALLLGAFGLSPRRLSDAIAAYVVMLWVVAMQAGTPNPAWLQAVLRQVRAAMRGRPPGTIRREVQPLLCCYVVVLARALEVARAAGQPAGVAQLGALARALGRATLGAGLDTLRLTPRGFDFVAEAAPKPAADIIAP